MLLSAILCIVAFLATSLLVRRGQPTLGLPLAYLYLLLLIHLPGVIAHLQPGARLPYRSFTETGIMLTAIGCWSFVFGLWWVRRRPPRKKPIPREPGSRFLLFCLLGGWIFTMGLRPFLVRIPSLGAAIDKGGMIWVLAILVGLGMSWRRRDYVAVTCWTAAIAVYPLFGLIKSGFLSFGTNAGVACCALLVTLIRPWWRSVVVVALVSFVGLGLFVSYFAARDDIRETVWGGAELGARIDESGRILRDYEAFDPSDPRHQGALNERLNQNIFAGMAAARLKRGVVSYYHGRTVVEGFMAVVPRALWPSKPVYGGSPKVISEMTGFRVNKTTSWGVGNVMEFYINFGIPSLIGGFVLLGCLLGWLDLQAGKALCRRQLPRLICYSLPAIALMHPGKSTVEMIGGAAAATVAALGWCWLWAHIAKSTRVPRKPARWISPDDASKADARSGTGAPVAK